MASSAIHDTASFTMLHGKNFKVTTTFNKTCNMTSYQRQGESTIFSLALQSNSPGGICFTPALPQYDTCPTAIIRTATSDH